MKKFTVVFLSILIVAFSFTACSSKPNNKLTEKNITNTIDTIFDALKEFDSSTVKRYVESSTLDTILTYASKKDQFRKLGVAMFENLQYEIKEIDTDNKTVMLAVKNKDLSEVASEYTKNLLKEYASISGMLQLLKDIQNDTWLDTNLSVLTKGISNAAMKDEETDITLSFEQKNDRLVFTFTQTAEDAVSGGALTAINNIF
ncbi:hypothetical protein IMSAG250_01111 [Clostridiales bacterium]|nr:hypothetical protein IMSAG250_01111 [Clostridiales bacterium]